MNRIFLSIICIVLMPLASMAQSIVGNWKTQFEMPNQGSPATLIVTLYLDNDNSLNANCELKMEIDALQQGTPEGLMQLGFATNTNGTWKRDDKKLTFNLNCDNLEVNCTEIMMPNLDVETANALVEKFMPNINSLKIILVEQFNQFNGMLCNTFTISKLTDDELALDDETGQSQLFTRADVGEYDPE